MLTKQTILVLGALTCGLAVAFGAFGAHALKDILAENQATETYALAAQYQFYHGLALLVIGAVMRRAPRPKYFGYASTAMVAGIVLFCGSLYALALTGTRTVVLVTPVGGLFFLIGWGLLLSAIVKNKQGP